MLSINFSDLSNNEPKFSRAVELLKLWFNAHRDATEISPSAVARFLRNHRSISFEDATQLALCLEWLVDRGVLKRRFAVQSPTGQLLHPYYRSQSEIPARVAGLFEEQVVTSEAEIKPIFIGSDDE